MITGALCAEVGRAMSLMPAVGRPAKVSHGGRCCVDDEVPGEMVVDHGEHGGSRKRIVSNMEHVGRVSLRMNNGCQPCAGVQNGPRRAAEASRASWPLVSPAAEQVRLLVPLAAEVAAAVFASCGWFLDGRQASWLLFLVRRLTVDHIEHWLTMVCKNEIVKYGNSLGQVSWGMKTLIAFLACCYGTEGNTNLNQR
jgi:hypothetical protein